MFTLVLSCSSLPVQPLPGAPSSPVQEKSTSLVTIMLALTLRLLIFLIKVTQVITHLYYPVPPFPPVAASILATNPPVSGCIVLELCVCVCVCVCVHVYNTPMNSIQLDTFLFLNAHILDNLECHLNMYTLPHIANYMK